MLTSARDAEPIAFVSNTDVSNFETAFQKQGLSLAVLDKALDFMEQLSQDDPESDMHIEMPAALATRVRASFAARNGDVTLTETGGLLYGGVPILVTGQSAVVDVVSSDGGFIRIDGVDFSKPVTA